MKQGKPERAAYTSRYHPLFARRRKRAQKQLEALLAQFGVPEVIRLLTDNLLASRKRMRAADPRDPVLNMVGHEMELIEAARRLLEDREAREE